MHKVEKVRKQFKLALNSLSKCAAEVSTNTQEVKHIDQKQYTNYLWETYDDIIVNESMVYHVCDNLL